MSTARPRKQAMQDILTVTELEEQVRRSQEGRTRKRALQEVKNRVFRFEPSNAQYVVLYATGPDWYKVGGNSALIYAYVLAPQIDRRPKFKSDTDFNNTFLDGVISIPKKNIPKLTEDLAQIKVRMSTEDEFVIIYELEKPLLRSELKVLRKKAIKEAEDFNATMMVENAYPQVTGMVRKLLPMIYSLYCSSPEAQRETFIGETLEYVKSIQRLMVAIANNGMTAEQGLKMTDQLLNKIFANISMMMTVGIMNGERALVYAKHLHAARVTVRAELERLDAAK